MASSGIKGNMVKLLTFMKWGVNNVFGHKTKESRKKNPKTTIKPNDRNGKGLQIIRRSTPLQKSAIPTPIHRTKNSNNILSTP